MNTCGQEATITAASSVQALERCRESFEKYIGEKIDWPVDERERGYSLTSDKMNRDEIEEWERDFNLDVNDRNPISGDSIQNEIYSEDVWEEESTNDEDVWKEDVWEVDVWEEDVMSEEDRDLMSLLEK